MSRRAVIGVMAMIYLVIALMPLAPLAMHSKTVAHAVTGECTGDCDTCGCSLESRANKTCCCEKKKQRQAEAATLIAGEGCSTKTTPVPAVAKGRFSDGTQPAVPVAATNDCCAKTGQDETTQGLDQQASPTKSDTVYKCGCPCGNGQLPTLAGSGSSELLPYIYSERILPSQEDTHYTPLPQRMASRHAEPPDPPPKLSIIS